MKRWFPLILCLPLFFSSSFCILVGPWFHVVWTQMPQGSTEKPPWACPWPHRPLRAWRLVACVCWKQQLFRDTAAWCCQPHVSFLSYNFHLCPWEAETIQPWLCLQEMAASHLNPRWWGFGWTTQEWRGDRWKASVSDYFCFVFSLVCVDWLNCYPLLILLQPGKIQSCVFIFKF